MKPGERFYQLKAAFNSLSDKDKDGSHARRVLDAAWSDISLLDRKIEAARRGIDAIMEYKKISEPISDPKEARGLLWLYSNFNDRIGELEYEIECIRAQSAEFRKLGGLGE